MKSSANCYNSKELLESFNDILFITQTLIINITRNEDKLKKISNTIYILFNNYFWYLIYRIR